MAQRSQASTLKQNPNQQNTDTNIPRGDMDPYYNSVWVFHTRFDIPKRYKLERPIGKSMNLEKLILFEKTKFYMKFIFISFLNVLPFPHPPSPQNSP